MKISKFFEDNIEILSYVVDRAFKDRYDVRLSRTGFLYLYDFEESGSLAIVRSKYEILDILDSGNRLTEFAWNEDKEILDKMLKELGL